MPSIWPWRVIVGAAAAANVVKWQLTVVEVFVAIFLATVGVLNVVERVVYRGKGRGRGRGRGGGSRENKKKRNAIQSQVEAVRKEMDKEKET